MSTLETGYKLYTIVEESDNGDSWGEEICDYGSSDCQSPCAIKIKSSVHVLSQVLQAKSKRCFIFWIVVLITCSCGCIYKANNFLTTFFQYPVFINVEVQSRNTQEFPAVTVCNLNRLRSMHAECSTESLSWLKCRFNFFSLRPKRPPELTELKALFSVSNETTESEINYKKRAKGILSGYNKLDSDSRKCYGHRLHDLIKRCSFNSVSCKHSDFSYFYDKHYGNCYTFSKSTASVGESLKVKRIGPESGLEMVLDIETDTYTSITPSSGARVAIHSPQEDPNPMERGVNIIRGFETHVSIAETSYERLPPPYRDLCKEYKVNGDLQRNQLTCTYECMQRTNLLMCGCVDPFLPNYKSMLLCNLVNATQMSCLVQTMDAMSVSNVTCDCPIPCTSTTYGLQVTSAKWSPGMRSSDDYFGKSYDPMFCSPGKAQESLESSAKLKVFFRSLEPKIFAQKPMYSDSELFSQLGGHFNLWLGLSFVVLYEFAEKIFIFLRHWFHLT